MSSVTVDQMFAVAQRQILSQVIASLTKFQELVTPATLPQSIASAVDPLVVLRDLRDRIDKDLQYFIRLHGGSL